MDSELFQKYRRSPIRDLLRQVAANPKMPVHADRLDDLGLPKRLRKALEESIDGIRNEQKFNVRQRNADKAAAIIVESAGLEHETTSERNHRRASEGDLEAMKAVEGEKQFYEGIADRISRKGI